jgi:hypothetical protein
MGILISLVFLGNLSGAGEASEKLINSISFSIPVLILGGLLIYTLRDKKK